MTPASSSVKAAALLLALFGAAFSARAFDYVSFHYLGDVRTAYLSRGKIGEDRPIQSNLAEADLSLPQAPEWGFIRLWHWHYNSLTTRKRHVRDRWFAEADWAVGYGNAFEFAEGWKLKAYVAPRFFNMNFYHHGDPGGMWVEWYGNFELENPYVTPVCMLRRCVHPTAYEYVYLQPGLVRKWRFLEDFTFTPGVFADLGDDRQFTASFTPREEGNYPGFGWMGVVGQAKVDYKLNDHFTFFVKLNENITLNHRARNNVHGMGHREYTIFSCGLDLRF